MHNLRYGLIMLLLLASPAIQPVSSAVAAVSIGIGLPNVTIGINLPMFPQLVRVPGYPVYYAPRMDANYFFYDGMYWVFQDDYWYASSWYNGPWSSVNPDSVPLYILRIPVRYYRQPPAYFVGWQSSAPPRWGQHWGQGWEQNRNGWNTWKRSSAPAPAPLPVYQKKYSGTRYPQIQQQQALHNQQYRYQPREQAVREHMKPQAERNQTTPAQRGRQEERPQTGNPRQPAAPHTAPLQQGAPAGPNTQPPQHGGEQVRRDQPQQRGSAVHDQKQQPADVQHEQQSPRQQGQDQRSPDRGVSREPNRDPGQGQNKDEDRGRGRDK